MTTEAGTSPFGAVLATPTAVSKNGKIVAKTEPVFERKLWIEYAYDF